MYIAPKEICCGCEACINVCPTSAISMLPDIKGFEYPFINDAKCIHCNSCRKTCPAIKEIVRGTEQHQHFYGAQVYDIQDLMNSSSGGAFIALARKIIAQGGVVFGCKLDKELKPIYSVARTNEQLLPFQGSKYAEAEIGTVFKVAKEELDLGRLVLFTGNPCKLEGLRHFLQRDYKNLICCEIICHGLPSRKFFSDYIEYEEDILNCQITNLSFRDKHRGWGYLLKLNYVNAEGNETIKYRRSEECYYFDYFNNGFFFRDSCYACKYASLNRCSDITIGDFWGIHEFYPEKTSVDGYSVIIASTERGRSLIESCKDELDLFNIKSEEATKYNQNIVKSTLKPDDNEDEWNIYLEIGVKEFAKRYALSHQKQILIGKFKRVIPFHAFITIRRLKKRLLRKDSSK